MRLDAHLAILGSGGVIVENLANVSQIESLSDAIVSVLPLSIPGADGSPVRAVAYENVPVQ
jgi:kynurenine formamidase